LSSYVGKKVIKWVQSSVKDGYIVILWIKYTLLTYMDEFDFKDYALFINSVRIDMIQSVYKSI
jgi:hypothetical protein